MKVSRRILVVGLFVGLVALVAVMPVLAAPGDGASVIRNGGTTITEFNHFFVHVYSKETFRLVQVDTGRITNYTLYAHSIFETSNAFTGEDVQGQEVTSRSHGTFINGEVQQLTLISEVKNYTDTDLTIAREISVSANGEVRVEHLWVDGEMVF
jgi:hypothetical protein